MINRDLIKNSIKTILKNTIIQFIVCYIISIYIRLVYLTSKIQVKGHVEEYINHLINNKATFVITWHGRIFIAPIFVKKLLKKISYKKQPCVLSSKHRDGQIASKTLNVFNFKEITGSTINRNKLYQAEDSGAVKSIMIIMKEIKNGSTIHLAPDGPRGPLREINSKIVDIAKKSSTTIFPVAINYNFKKQLKSWDEFQVPFPFGKITIEYLEPLYLDKKNNDSIDYNLLLKERMNEAMVYKE